MTTSALRIERDGAVARVWLDRPEIRNALNAALIGELAAAFTALAAADGVRAIVVGGSGKAFCAGADLGAMRDAASFTWEQNHADAARLAEMLWSLYSCPVPVIARIHGDCYAGGLGIASVCDIRVVAEGVTFSLSEARLGLLPATISPYVINAIGARWARRYFQSAEVFTAAHAREIGLVHEVVGETELAAAGEKLIEAILRGAPGAQAAAKDLVFLRETRPVDATLGAETSRRIAERRTSAEGREGIAAFLAKRKPDWRPS